MVVATVTFGDMLISKTMTVMTSDHTKTKIDVFHKTNGQANCGMEWGVRTWSPESPDLYDITFEVVSDGKILDTVGSYFAMREIRIDGSNILLNGHPLYQRLILDQGYWKDSHLTPPSEEALIEDIDKIHELGYNGLRKHQKTEDERFLYWCDVKGMLVWCEMAAAYEYSDKAVEEFTREWTEIVRQNYNHPCIITWTPVNESWGVSQVETDPMQQHFTEMLYHLTKSMDRYRPVIVNDGWEQTRTDIYGLHDYAAYGDMLYAHFADAHTLEKGSNDHRICRAEGYPRGMDEALLVTEYGGIAFADGDEESWGYHDKVSGIESFFERYASLQKALFEIPGCQGYCYTQLTDVQQETNGLLTPDRKPKIDPDRFAKLTTNPPTRYN